MYLKPRTLIAIVFGALSFYLYVSNVRPVSWFDSMVGMIIGLPSF